MLCSLKLLSAFAGNLLLSSPLRLHSMSAVLAALVLLLVRPASAAPDAEGAAVLQAGVTRMADSIRIGGPPIRHAPAAIAARLRLELCNCHCPPHSHHCHLPAGTS